MLDPVSTPIGGKTLTPEGISSDLSLQFSQRDKVIQMGLLAGLATWIYKE